MCMCHFSCVFVCIQKEEEEEGVILATHLRWAILLLFLQARTQLRTHKHTHRALCQASCSLAGAGNTPERVVASICSTGERLGCVSEPVCVFFIPQKKKSHGIDMKTQLAVLVVGVCEFRVLLVK